MSFISRPALLFIAVNFFWLGPAMAKPEACSDFIMKPWTIDANCLMDDGAIRGSSVQLGDYITNEHGNLQVRHIVHLTAERLGSPEQMMMMIMMMDARYRRTLSRQKLAGLVRS
jgi:hypothetical protein